MIDDDAGNVPVAMWGQLPDRQPDIAWSPWAPRRDQRWGL